MKANNGDLCRANVFIKTRSTKDGAIPDEDTQIVVVSTLVTYISPKFILLDNLELLVDV
jgi:hypothetical protein